MGLFDSFSIPLITTAPLNAAVYSDAVTVTNSTYESDAEASQNLWGWRGAGGLLLPDSSTRQNPSASPLVTSPNNIVTGNIAPNSGGDSSLLGIGIIALIGIAIIGILK